MKSEKRYDVWFVVLVYAWITALIVGVVKHLPAVAALSMTGCMDDISCEMPTYESCTFYMSLMRSVDDPGETPSLTPADFGVRIIVDTDFNPLMGSSYPVPGGRIAWNVWTFHWYDGPHLGAVGRINDSLQCHWFGPK
jgi:hypothetical protein